MSRKNYFSLQSAYILSCPKKGATIGLLFSITFPAVYRFSNFFHNSLTDLAENEYYYRSYPFLSTSLHYLVKCLYAKKHPASELSEANCHERLSHSKQWPLEALRQCIPPPRDVLPVSRSDPWSGSPPTFNHLFIGSLPTWQPSLKIACRSVQKFVRTVPNRQTDK